MAQDENGMRAVSFDFSYKFTDGKFITSYKFTTSLKKKKRYILLAVSYS